MNLDADVVRDKFADIARPTGRLPEDVAHGFIQIAVQQMANAIKKISVARGYDVTRYTLQCFGGAGGQHACLVADALGMSRVFVHPLAGVLSAYGMGLADQTVIREQAVELSSGEYNLLVVLARHAGEVLSRDQIMDALKGHPLEAFDRSIDVHISRIRAEIEDDPREPRRIVTVRGAGYVFAQRQDDSA